MIVRRYRDAIKTPQMGNDLLRSVDGDIVSREWYNALGLLGVVRLFQHRVKAAEGKIRVVSASNR